MIVIQGIEAPIIIPTAIVVGEGLTTTIGAEEVEIGMEETGVAVEEGGQVVADYQLKDLDQILDVEKNLVLIKSLLLIS
jgi:hypothetical protein